MTMKQVPTALATAAEELRPRPGPRTCKACCIALQVLLGPFIPTIFVAHM